MENRYVIGKNIETKIITEDKLNILLDFQREIIDKMQNKEWFTPLTKEEFLIPLQDKDNDYIFTYKKEVIGMLVLTCNIKEVLEEYKLPKGDYMLIDSIMIKDNYRGYGLQRQLLKYAYNKALEQKVDGLVATVHPDNIYSLNNFLKEGYQILHTLQIHGGKRHVMIKYIDK